MGVIENKRREIKRLTAEAEAIRRRFEGRDMPREVFNAWSSQIEKATAIQNEIKSWEKEVPKVPLPESKAEREARKRRERRGGMNTKTSMTPGDAFVESPTYAMFKSESWPRATSPKIALPPFQTKAIPTLSVSDATTFPVIVPGRDMDVPRAAERERLRLRDIVTIQTTGSDVVQYVKIDSGRPEAASGVAPGELKPEGALALSVAQVPIRVIAIHMPVTVQMLEDVSSMRALIDGELRFDVLRFEEYQMVWGDGLNEGLLGIMNTPNVDAFTRTPEIGAGTTVTLLDEIRGAVSDIAVDGHEATGVLLHPFDFETLALSKGSDDHYLALTFPSQASGLRLWSLDIVESLAAENYRSGLSANQRVVIVGDFQRGCTLYDRSQLTVELGMIEDQFVRNLRTLLAEERIGFAVKRPSALRHIETVAAGT